jgi:hypothetical protein
MEYARTRAVYRCRVIKSGAFKVISDPVVIEFQRGPIAFDGIVQHARVNVIGHGGSVLERGKVELPAGENYLMLTARSAEADAKAWAASEEAIDRMIAQLSLFYGPQLFMEQLYRGPLVDKKMMISFSVRPAEPQQVEQPALQKHLDELRFRLRSEPDKLRAFNLMSRFYSKAITYEPGEEYLMMLWTALEIYPMTATTNIKAIVEMMSRVSGQPAAIIQQHFQIGRLHGIRSDLVHNGEIARDDYRDVLRRLELLVHEAMRDLLGLPYGGALEILEKSRQADEA